MTKKCNFCGNVIYGIEHDGYLWPVWMMKPNSSKYPPHGPRLFKLDINQCWRCSIVKGTKWHR